MQFVAKYNLLHLIVLLFRRVKQRQNKNQPENQHIKIGEKIYDKAYFHKDILQKFLFNFKLNNYNFWRPVGFFGWGI